MQMQMSIYLSLKNIHKFRKYSFATNCKLKM